MTHPPEPTKRTRLTRDAVLRAAATLADEHGIDALTLAGLADSLGIRTPSLYNHVSSLDDLRRGLALLALTNLGVHLDAAVAGSPTGDHLIAVTHAYRRYALDHPGLYAAIARGASPGGDPAINAASRALFDVVIRVLPADIPDEATAIHAVRTLRSLMHGFISLDTMGGFGLPVDIDASFAFAVELFRAGLVTVGAPVKPERDVKAAE